MPAEYYLSLLVFVGAECPGSLRIESAKSAELPSANCKLLRGEELRELVECGAVASTTLLRNTRRSLVGAMGKVPLCFQEGKWYEPFGSAVSTHVVKQSHVRLQHNVENERLVLRTAEKLGIPTAKSVIIRCEGAKASGLYSRYRHICAALRPFPAIGVWQSGVE